MDENGITASRFPVDCTVTGHDFARFGVCHGIGIAPNGRPYAIVEYDNYIPVEIIYLDDNRWVTLK